jgi:hypothetical protein
MGDALSPTSDGSHLALSKLMKRLALLLLVVGGCTTDNNQRCLEAGTDIADIEYRDPSTGQCQSFGQNCDSSCGPCPALSDIQPDWGTCAGACESLSETQCLATASCHAAYQDDSAAHPVFWGCWDMPPSGVLHGSCANLDAQTCSEHDDCTSLYTGPVNQPPNFVPSFESCQSESMQAACATLSTETSCLARTDCDPVYIGMNCTCDAHGCTCQNQTFSQCQ